MSRESLEQKALHVFCNAFWQPDGANGISGGDVRVIELLKRWKQKDVIVYAPSSFYALLKTQNGMTVTGRITFSGKQPRNLFFAYFCHTVGAVIALPKCKRRHIFYSSSDFFPDVIPCILGKWLNPHSKWVAVVHHIIEHYTTRPGNRLKNIMAWYAQRISIALMKLWADRVLVVSPMVYEMLLNKKFSKDMIFRVDNGIDTVLIEKSVVPVLESYDAVFCARLVPSKGIDDIAYIWKKVCSFKPDARLALIGGYSSSVKERLALEFAQTGIERNIHFLGFVSAEEKYVYMKNSSIFFFPSHEEGWGIVVAEALACKMQVVCYGLSVFIPLFGSFLHCIEPYDKDAMSKKIVELLQEAKANELGADFVYRNYSWDEIARREQRLVWESIG